MNKMVTLFTVYVSFSWVYTQKRHHCPDLSPLDYWFWSQCLAELRRNPTNNIQVLKNTINTFAETITNEQARKLCLTLQPEPDVVFRSLVGLLSINSRKWNIDCKQCNHLIHDVYFLKNISLKCPNQTTKMTPSFLKLDHSKAV